MSQRKTCIVLFLALILGLLASACASQGEEPQQPDPEEVAVIVALTQTAAALEAREAIQEATPVPNIPSSRLQNHAKQGPKPFAHLKISLFHPNRAHFSD